MNRLGLFFLCLLQLSCSSQTISKINGVSFVGSRDKALQKHIDPVVRVNASHAAVMPFGFVRNLSDPTVIFDTERQWFGETRAGGKQYIAMLRKNGIKIMLKPQIWVWRGEFTGDIKMEKESDWKEFERTYEDFALAYAKLAEETQAEIYCIGTELEDFVSARPEFWKRLINKIRAVYSGKLTYAANWDEYTRTPFWKDLDYIGVDAYFPLSEARDPTKAQMKAGWQKWKTRLQELSKSHGRKVLFTEFGYRSMDYTAKKPWLVDQNQMRVNLQAQASATAALFEEFWMENWFAGGFVWKWFIHHEDVGGSENNRFTPQNKPAESVIRDFYADYRLDE
ncbi:glycoside hydrolase [Flagellimonas sp. DF-77]|uniref:glycoside hydrolase family 113 n=1 Tax=Flagellimonas algarum TaxID=3230298 RepID=UPI00339AD8D1